MSRPRATATAAPADDDPIFAGLTDAQRAALDTSLNLAVKAGAGSGKTTVLSRRYVRLLELGRVPVAAAAPGAGDDAPLRPAEILTLTFTRKAAAEMRERIAALVAARADAAPDEAARLRWLGLLDELDLAPISTIHAFCRQALEEFSLRAGLDPAFDLCDDFDEQEHLADAIARALADAGREDDPALAWLAASWRRDEVEGALGELLGAAPLVREVIDRLPAPGAQGVVEWLLGPDAPARFDALDAELAPGGGVATFVEGAARALAAACLTPAPEGRPALLVAALAAARDARRRGDQLAFLDALADLAALPLKNDGEPYTERSLYRYFYGVNKTSPEGKRLAAAEAGHYLAHVAAVRRLADLIAPLPSRADLELAPDFAALLALFDRAERTFRALLDRDHQLTQDDLLLGLRRLLREQPEVLGVLRRRFRQVMVDEFQDTDPVQWEIVRLLAGDDDDGTRLAPARLFLVGDDKQSIYRFRGADVAVFAAAARAIADGPAPGRVLDLGENFRTLPPVLAAINGLASRLFAWDEAAAGPRPPFVAEDQPLRAGREAPPGLDGSVEVALYRAWTPADDRGEEEAADADEDEDAAAWRALEPLGAGEAAARAVRRVLGWCEGGEPLRVRGGPDGAPRAAQPSDVMVLMQTRRDLVGIERAFQAHAIPYVVEGGTGFYQAQEVYDARNLLAALADPDDDIALVGVLRGPLFALTDLALTALAEQPGAAWGERLAAAAAALAQEPPAARDSAPHGSPGTEAAAALLRALDDEDRAGIEEAATQLARWRTLLPHVALADLIQLAFDETGAWGAVAVGSKGPQRLANLDKLTALAREFERGGLRGADAFVEMLDRMDEEFGVREGLADVADERPGVRVVTVHGSKGREAPVVVVADTDRATVPRDGRVLVLREQRVGGEGGVRVEMALRPPAWLAGGGTQAFRRVVALRREIEAREVAEGARLFYVAATRARDHLLLVARARVEARRRWTHALFAGLGGDKPADDTRWLRAAALHGCWGDTAAGRPGYLEVLRPLSLHEILPPPVAPAGRTPAAAPPPPAAPAAPAAAQAPAADPLPDAPRVHELPASAAGTLDRDFPRFYREVILGDRGPGAVAVKKPARSLSAAELGTMVHRALQEGIATPEAARELVWREAAGLGLFREDPRARRELEAAARVVEESVARHAAGDLAALLREGHVVRREQALAVALGGLRFGGRLDLLALPTPAAAAAGARPLLVDYKTTRVAAARDAERAGADPLPALAADAEARGYFLQLGLYALAVERAGLAAAPRLGVHYTRQGRTVWRDWDAAAAADLLRRAAGWERRLAQLDFGDPWPGDAPPDGGG